MAETGFQCSRLVASMVVNSPWTLFFLCVEEEGDCPGLEKDLSGGVLRDDPVLVVKLHILEAELDRPPERVSLCVLAGSQAEEEGNMDEVG